MILTPHLGNLNAAKFGCVYNRGQGDINDYNFSPYEEIGATPTTFYLNQWKPYGFTTCLNDGSGSPGAYVYSYDMYE